MCTGDTSKSAKRLAEKLGIRDYRYEVRPEDKNKLILEKKKEGITAMIGDGINDALALSNADISITIKSASDIASASSDIILMKNDLNDLLFIHKLGKKTMRIIKENLFWALAYNTICIPLAAGLFSRFGLMLNPMISAIGMWISSMFVLANALRINSVKEIYEKND